MNYLAVAFGLLVLLGVGVWAWRTHAKNVTTSLEALESKASTTLQTEVQKVTESVKAEEQQVVQDVKKL